MREKLSRSLNLDLVGGRRNLELIRSTAAGHDHEEKRKRGKIGHCHHCRK
jgi:hypothetical protein